MGRFVDWKRFDLVLRAVSLLPPGSVELHLIGDGPERQSLERLAMELGIHGQTRFHGYLADPFPVLKKACIGVLPSQFEAFGNVIVEMFAAGLPVVAFDVNYGPREIIRDGENGILVRALEPKDLAEALSKLLKDVDLRRKMGANARQEAERRYGVAGAVRTYEECFSLLRGRSRAAIALSG
jgi:glycosyltransferase involved in cell wall biosynthesis